MARVAEILQSLRDPLIEYVGQELSGNIEINLNGGQFMGYNLHIYRKKSYNGRHG
jgi:hypothetical protein